jgi:[ribosomal protein S18]-alanine N-acetyltransferase
VRKPRPEPFATGATGALTPSIARITGAVEDVAAIDAIAAESFTGYGFSVEEELSRPWARIWIARDETSDWARPVGFLVSWHVADEVHVLNIATALDVRRRGIATAMMREALRYAAGNRVRIVLLEVRRSNRAALRLYRQLGFTAMGVRPGYYSDNGEDAVEMVLGLDPETGRFLPGKDEIRIDV